jgi:hypothetical protein
LDLGRHNDRPSIIDRAGVADGPGALEGARPVSNAIPFIANRIRALGLLGLIECRCVLLAHPPIGKARQLARFVVSTAVRLGYDGFAANRAIDLAPSPQSRRRSHHAVAASWAGNFNLCRIPQRMVGQS